MHATSSGEAPAIRPRHQSAREPCPKEVRTDDLREKRVRVVLDVRPLALVRVVKVPFNSSERVSSLHVCARAYHTSLTTPSSLRRRAPAHACTPARASCRTGRSTVGHLYVGSISTQGTKWGFAMLTLIGAQGRGGHGLVCRERELVAGGHGGLGELKLGMRSLWGKASLQASDRDQGTVPLLLHCFIDGAPPSSARSRKRPCS
jgi:hypothetical protein